MSRLRLWIFKSVKGTNCRIVCFRNLFLKSTFSSGNFYRQRKWCWELKKTAYIVLHNTTLNLSLGRQLSLFSNIVKNFSELSVIESYLHYCPIYILQIGRKDLICDAHYLVRHFSHQLYSIWPLLSQQSTCLWEKRCHTDICTGYYQQMGDNIECGDT